MQGDEEAVVLGLYSLYWVLEAMVQKPAFSSQSTMQSDICSSKQNSNHGLHRR